MTLRDKSSVKAQILALEQEKAGIVYARARLEAKPLRPLEKAERLITLDKLVTALNLRIKQLKEKLE